VYTRGFRHATFQVLEDNTTDHHLVLTTIESGVCHNHLIKLNCRHFKAIHRDALESALSQRNWSGIYAIKDVEEVHKFSVDGIIAALDVVAPVKEIVVKTVSNLYLMRETLEMIKRKDSARNGMQLTVSSSGTSLPAALRPLPRPAGTPGCCGNWPTTRSARPRPVSHRRSSTRRGKPEADNTINSYFISKVDSLRAASKSAT
jgi:hypothetical protein